MTEIPLYIYLFFILLVLLVAYFLYKKNSRKYLVFSSVGDVNNVDSWSAGNSKRNFDIIVYYYGEEDDPKLVADLIVKRKGLKLDNFYHFLNTRDIEKYKAIWLVDDDIVMGKDSINKMFAIFTEYNLFLAQPSYTEDSVAPWAITHNNPDCILRYTNFVEVGVPLFSIKAISTLHESFANSGTGFGLDYIWPSLLGFPKDKIAVIDDVQCLHPDKGYSALDNIMPRSMHLSEGVDLLIRCGLLEEGWRPTEINPWPKPYEPVVYSRIANH